jgi:anti-sigma regulatory factor (Ser/Thr protein kinase)
MLSVVNTDLEVQQMVETALGQDPRFKDELKFLTNEAEIFDYLNFGFPELIFVNFTDPVIDIDSLMEHIKNDKWLLSFGVVGIFSNQKRTEEELYEKYGACNVLIFMETYRVRSHMAKILNIVEDNYQIIFQRELSNSLMDTVGGSFTIENDILAVSLYASIGATILAQRGLMYPNNKMLLQLALEELIVNAVEHGNCGITYEEKTQGMADGLSVVDLVAEKCKDPAIKARTVEFQWEIQAQESVFTITDEGDGFDVKAYLKKVAEQDVLSQHGRGIKIASKVTGKINYNAKGNKVTVTVKHDVLVEHEIPAGFAKAAIVSVKPGENVLNEGEAGDYLYYIISGKYDVYHEGNVVGTLCAQDIFMGEMAFILNQKRTASVKATTEGKLIYLSRKTLINVIKDYPQYGLFLTKLLAKRLLRSNQLSADARNTQ